MENKDLLMWRLQAQEEHAFDGSNSQRLLWAVGMVMALQQLRLSAIFVKVLWKS